MIRIFNQFAYQDLKKIKMTVPGFLLEACLYVVSVIAHPEGLIRTVTFLIGFPQETNDLPLFTMGSQILGNRSQII